MTEPSTDIDRTTCAACGQPDIVIALDGKLARHRLPMPRPLQWIDGDLTLGAWCSGSSTAPEPRDWHTARMPEPSTGPRTWSLPPDPGPDVTAVRDRQGRVWTREEDGWIYRESRPSPRIDVVYRTTWAGLFMQGHSPFTDATTEA